LSVYLRLRGFVARLLTTGRERRAVKWMRSGFDKTLRLEYDLTSSSIVLDLGGYEGQWSQDIFDHYGCTIFIFEPVPEFAKGIRERFIDNPKIVVHEFGLAGVSGTARIVIDSDRSSMFPSAALNRSRIQEIRLVRAADFINEQKLSSIDLMKVNIEGGEYDLLEHLIKENLVSNITEIQVQFHNFVPKASRRMRDIQSRLEDTHRLTYQSEFVWENWQRRSHS
jgi:FkbM family methyltransferase